MIAPSKTRQDGQAPQGRAMLREGAILRATLELLTEVGYDRTSIDAVAARARSSKTTIYRRWPNKAELVVAAVKRYAGHQLVAQPDAGSLRADLVNLVRAMCEALAGQDAALILALATAARADPELGLTVRMQILDDKRVACAAVVERAVARGEAASKAAADMLADVCSAMLFARLCITGEPLDDAFVFELIDVVLMPMLTSPVPGARAES